MAHNYEEKQAESYLGFCWDENPFTRELSPDKSGDIAIIGGLDNLSNAIYRRIKTPLGWYPEYPWYGSRLREMIGMGNTYENRELIATWVEESLLYERRIIDGTLSVSVNKDSSDYRAVRILITCRVVSFPSSNTFVYDFFLRSGDLAQVGVQ